MAKLTRQAIEKIIKEQMPGYRVVEHGPLQDAVAKRVQADHETPDLDALKRAVREQSRGGNPGEEAEDAAGGEEGEDQMVVLTPENPSSPLDHGAKAKVVVVSARDRKIVTSQG